MYIHAIKAKMIYTVSKRVSTTSKEMKKELNIVQLSLRAKMKRIMANS
jgi:hypothetical protein